MSSSSLNPIILMGVQGSGKSTIGALLAQETAFTFVDGDDLHSAEAKAKMASGQPLNDEDRAPWLRRIALTIAEAQDNGEILAVACSALKKQYRDAMREIVPNLVFVHLAGQQALIANRLTQRNHEYMPTTLLDSQYETLEPLAPGENGFSVDVTSAPNDVVGAIVSKLGQR